MNLRLAPAVVRTLDGYRRRRAVLSLVAALAAGVLVTLAGLTVAAVLDWRVLLPDRTRWALSLAAYAAGPAVALAVWAWGRRAGARSRAPSSAGR